MKNWLFFAGFSTLLSCTDSPERRYEKMANGWCNCVSPLVEINARAQVLAAQTDTTAEHKAELKLLFRQIEAVQKSAAACSTILKDKYGALKTEEMAAAKPFFWNKCPKMQAYPEILSGMLGE